jgi:hypothetical protein
VLDTPIGNEMCVVWRDGEPGVQWRARFVHDDGRHFVNDIEVGDMATMLARSRALLDDNVRLGLDASWPAHERTGPMTLPELWAWLRQTGDFYIEESHYNED